MTEKHSKTRSIWDLAIVRRATLDSMLKLNPRHMMKNPVMFVVEVGSVATTLLLLREGASGSVRVQSADHALAVVHGNVRQLC